MHINNIKLASRKLWRQKSFTALNIVGLSLATMSCILIMIYVQWERSFDNFRSPDVYRIASYGFQNNVEVGKSAQVIPALAPALKHDMPEVIDAVRLAHTGPFMADPVMQYGNKTFRESRIYFADPTFLNLFSYHLTRGSVNDALAKPDQVVLSSSTAKKYFNNGEALGKTITFHMGDRGTRELLVTGVFNDVPGNSHLHTDFVISFATLPFNLDADWGWGNFYTYIKLLPNTDPQAFEAKIPNFLRKHIRDELEAQAKSGYRMQLVLQPIQGIHLDSNLWGELEVNGDRRTTQFLIVIAIFILVIAWVNYINFAIARSMQNSKEISIRKISGSNRFQLMLQLITESALINIIAILIAVAALQLVLPLIQVMVGLPDGVALMTNHLWMLGLLFVAGTLCAGIYPAYFISTLNPITLLKSKVTRAGVNINLNRALIVFQFTASIILIIGTVTIFHQLRYMRTQALGLDLNQTLIVKGPSIKDSSYLTHLDFFYGEIEKLKGVSGMAVSSSIPGQELHWGRGFYRQDDPVNSIGANIVAVDEKFFDLFNASFAAGSNFSDASTINQDAIILNEKAVNKLGYNAAEAVGKIIMWDESNTNKFPKRVVGVVKDFNQQSLRQEVQPIVFTLKKYVDAPWAGEFYAFKIPTDNIESSIASIEKVWKEVYTGNPFDYFFLDQFFNAQYKNDEQFGKIFSLFSILAIVIACLGLFGLSSYITALRTKEIGVRKVLGSSASSIVALLSKDFMIWVVIAFVMACPIGAYVMNQWLSQFAYQISLDVWIFALSGFICFFVALITVGVKSYRAANVNPAKALQYE